jgi:hypothetical protein
MALTFTNYSSSVDSMSDEKNLLYGASNSTIVKSLEVITGNESCTLNVIRKKQNASVWEEYANIKIDLKANDYLLLWEGFFVIPSGHGIWIKCNSKKCRVIANVVEMKP